jgi:uncharacterized protein YpiB (UPF0302 family)
MAKVVSLKCPECGAKIPMKTAEAAFTFKYLRCMGCAFDEVVERYRQGDKAVETEWKEVIEKAAAIKVEQELNNIPKHISREAILRMVDEALDSGNEKEFNRLTKLLEGGDV